MGFRRWILVLLTGFAAHSAQAHPVTYQGATGVMTWNQPFMSDHWITYSFRRDMAIAGRFMRMEMQDGQQNYSGLQLNYLLKRWNGDDYQANIYVYGGGGVATFDEQNSGAYFGGFEADAEDRKFFSLIKAEYMKPTAGDDFGHVEGRLGVAPYEAEYNEIASWFMVQAQWHPTLEKKFVVTPLARLFYKSFLFETGVSLEGDWMMNFMFHF
ncbi:MAG TPA: hypothetical protein VM432_02770 [Bdellovibrionales bacterium]|nr:hypothetical protein [Bdellovibrionales bacterium]